MASRPGKNQNSSKLANVLQDGVALQRAGQVTKALQLYKKMLKTAPNQPDLLHLMGLCYHQQKNYAKAANLIEKSLSFAPNNPVVHNNLGVALYALGKQQKAENQYREAIKLQPSYAEAHKNLASLLCNRQDFEKAISHYQIAVQNAPQHFNTRVEFGKALVSLGRPSEALKQYEVALKLNPRDADLLTDVAIALKSLGRTNAALPYHLQAMKLSMGENRHLFAFANTISGQSLQTRSDELDQMLLTLLECRQVNPAGVLSPALSSLMLQDGFRTVIERLSSRETASEPVTNGELELLAGNALFLKTLEMLPLAREEFELALSRVRHDLLLSPTPHDQKIIRFVAALASQCFNNEYAYFVTPQEQQALTEREDQIKAAIGDQKIVDPFDLVLLACYKPLFMCDFRSALVEMHWPEELGPVIERQLHEPIEELELRATISGITKIEDTVSQQVRAQYEDNPYPRWIYTGIPRESRKIGDFLSSYPLQFDLGDYETPNRPDVLVAGCGTGQHSLQTATRFSNTRVLAIDLSLASLAYAKRQTQKLGVKNIEFRHADILELGALDKKFDLIECAGVLHHLKDPIAGWRVLYDLLKPGGLMKIGLYSEIARQDIVEARKYIAAKGYSGNTDDIRACRHEILTGNTDLPIQLKKRSDFYSLSACRDLIFHIQEHRFTLPQIESILDELGLEFIDFEIQAPHHFTAKQAEINKTVGNTRLKLWHEYETEFPSTFSNMYQFWCRKPKTA